MWYKHTDCYLSSTLCPSNLICVTVSVRWEVCGGVLILPHSGLDVSITQKKENENHKTGTFDKFVNAVKIHSRERCQGMWSGFTCSMKGGSMYLVAQHEACIWLHNVLYSSSPTHIKNLMYNKSRMHCKYPTATVYKTWHGTFTQHTSLQSQLSASPDIRHLSWGIG